MRLTDNLQTIKLIRSKRFVTITGTEIGDIFRCHSSGHHYRVVSLDHGLVNNHEYVCVTTEMIDDLPQNYRKTIYEF